jgi:hypothetical protein
MGAHNQREINRFFYSFLLSSLQWWFWLGTPHVTVVTSFPSLSIE